MVRSTLLHFFCQSSPSGKFSDFTVLRYTSHFKGKIRNPSHSVLQALDLNILEYQSISPGVESNLQMAIQSGGCKSNVHISRGPKFQNFPFRAIFRGLRASFSGLSARSRAKAKTEKWCEALSSASSVRAALRVNSRISRFCVTQATSMEKLEIISIVYRRLKI